MDFSDLIPSAAPDSAAEAIPSAAPDSMSFDDLIPKKEMDGFALTRGLKRGLDYTGQFLGSAVESLGEATGIDAMETFGRDTAAFNRAQVAGYAPGMTTEDLNGLGSTASFIGEKLGESAPPMATSIAAAAGAGAIAGSVVPGLGTVAGALVGAGAATLANLPYMFGSMRERQKDADIQAGRKIEVDDQAALFAAVPASALDSVSDLFLIGKFGKFLKPLTENTGLFTRVISNVATGVAVESPTELGQTIIERFQAGLSLTDEEAQAEYFEAAVAGGLVGGTVSGAMSIPKPRTKPDTAPDVENIPDAGGTAEQALALSGDPLPDATAPPVTGDVASTAPPTPSVSPEEAAALARTLAQSMQAERRTTPPPAPSQDLTPEQRAEAGKAQAAELVPPVVSPPVPTPDAVVAPEVTPVGSVPPPAEGELSFDDLTDTALNEEVPEQAASADEIPTVPEAPEQIEAQMAGLVDLKDKRAVVFAPFGGVVPAIPKGTIARVEVKDGYLFYNYQKSIGGKKLNKNRVKFLDEEGRRNELLGLGPLNKDEIAAEGPLDLGVVERTPDGVAVKEVAATGATVPDQVAAIEELAPEGNTVEVLPAEVVLEERAAAGAAAIATSQARGKAQVVNKLSPEEQARIDEEYDEQAFKVKRAALDADIAKAAEEVKTDRKEVILQKANRGELSAEEEITVRINEKQAKKNPKIAKEKLERFRAVTAFFAENIPTTPEAIRNMADATAVFERLKETVAKANKLGLRVLPKARVSDEMPNALAWLVQLNGFARKAEAFATATPGTRTEMMGELMDYLANEQILLATGDSTPIREERKRTADAIAAAKRGVEADTIAGVQSDESSEAATDEDEVAKIVRSDADEFSDDDAGDNLSAAESTADETADEDTQDDDDFMQLGPDEVPIGEDGLPGRARAPVEIEGEAYKALAPQAKPFEKTDKPKPKWATRPGKITIRRSEGIGTPEEQAELREKFDSMFGIPYYDRELTNEIREEISQGVHPESVLAQDQMGFRELAEEVSSDEFTAALAKGTGVIKGLQAKLQATVTKKIFQTLLDVIGDVRVYVLSDADMDQMAGPGTAGYYRQDGDFIAVRASSLKDPAKMAHILSHEGSHAAFEHTLDSNPKLADQLKELMKQAEKFAAKTGYDVNARAFDDVHEFLSEVFSNPEFQQFLSSVPITTNEKYAMNLPGAKPGAIRDVMSWIRKTLSDILGVEAAFKQAGYAPGTTSALDEAVRMAGRMIELAPDARVEFYSKNPPLSYTIRASDGGFAKGSNEEKLVKLGLSPEQASAVAKVIDEELGGTATDAEINALASYVSRPIHSVETLTAADLKPLPPRVAKPLGQPRVRPPAPPLKGRGPRVPKQPAQGGKPPIGPKIAAIFSNAMPGPRGAPQASSWLNFKLYLSTLDFINAGYRQYFVDAKGNALDDYTNAAFEFDTVVQGVAQVHDQDFAVFEDFKRDNAAEAQKITDLVSELQGADVNLGPNANNDHLKGNARVYIQAKANLPQLQADYAALSPEAKAIFDDMAAHYRASFEEYITSVTDQLLSNLAQPLAAPVRDRIMQNVLDGKLDDTDKAALNDDDLFKQLQTSTFLKRRKGLYFPAQREGNWVVTTTAVVDDPGITSVVTKSGRATVPIKTEIDKGTVTLSFDHTVRGARGAVEVKLRAWIASHDMNMMSFMERYRDRLTGEIVSKGEMDVTRDYDMAYIVKFQVEGVHFFESDTEARAFQKEAAADVKAGILSRTSQALDRHVEHHPDAVIGNAALDAVLRSFNKNDKLDKNPIERKRLENILRDTITMQTVGNRYEKRLMNRKNVIGASDQIGRAAASYGRSVGNAIATIRVGKKQSAALTRMREIADAKTDDADGPAVQAVFNEMITREKLLAGATKNKQWLDNITSINAIDKLMSPANWFLNSTQVYMNLLPMLSGAHGPVNAGRVILSAYKRVGAAGALAGGAKNLGRNVTQAGKHQIELEDVIGSIRKNVGPAYDKLFETLISRKDIAANVGIENASQLASGRSKLGTGLVKLDRIMRAMPNAIEAINRSVSAVASYDLAIAKGMSPQEAIDYASDMVRATQFRYDDVNKSRMMRSNPGLKFFFTFKQFGQGQYQMLARAVGTAYRGESREVRVAALKQLGTLLLVQGMTAGLYSLPGIELVKVLWVFAMALGLTDDNWDDLTERLKVVTRDSMGATAEEIVSKGVLSKVMGVDLSQRMSWADLFTGWPPADGSDKALFEWAGKSILGPQGGMFVDVFKGLAKLNEGLSDGSEKDIAAGLSLLLPVKVVSDVVKAVGGVSSGDMNVLDAAKQVLGFKSLNRAREGDATGVEMRASKKKKKEVNELISDFYDATSKSDILRATAAIRQYNAGLGEDERQISISGLQKKKLAEARAN